MSARTDRCGAITLPAVQRALRRTTEFIAAELARPGTAAPGWSATEWQVARAAATMHGVCGLLAHCLRWQGPDDWPSFLAAQRGHVAARQARIEELLASLDAAALRAGVAMVALKGAALHARGFYQAGERPMADVDLLVSEAHVPQVAELLAQLGYRPGQVTWKHRAFEPAGSPRAGVTAGEDASDPIKIELHSQIREILPLRAVDMTAVAWPVHTQPGINAYPSHAALLLHVLLHASGALLMRTARLLHLVDIARLTQHMTAAQWDSVFDTAARTDDPTLWWAYPPLALTSRYFGCVPETVLARTGAACHWPLRRAYHSRRLSEVSLSYLWVSAFPGIEWSRSLREMSAYARERLMPGAETVALRAAFAHSQPQVSGGEWAELSQGRRVLRWLLARQPRQETLQPVRAFLARG